MKQSTKLMLDIVMAAVIPILILRYLTEPLGAPMAYVVAALVPVGWVFADLFLITKRFNFITSYIGLSAIIRGALAFWFVDGVLFAIKDTASYIFATLLFGGMLLVGRPILQYFMAQALNPDTVDKETALNDLFRERNIYRALVIGTWIIVVTNILTGIANFWLNWVIVVAPFGTEAFNLQVAQVNAITRVALTFPDLISLSAAIWIVYRALFKQLPSEEGKSQFESDFWDLVRLKQAQHQELPSSSGS
ncbi:MAG: hypothetical protein MI924_17300 [Chloroflexales bacterium]|nr:hypothetical protein [Chloroflexales bacterium]